MPGIGLSIVVAVAAVVPRDTESADFVAAAAAEWKRSCRHGRAAY
jgi:hypothetical protein